MNPAIARILTKFYRKEPLSGFLILMGAVDLVVGGADRSLSLVGLAATILTLGVGLRWWHTARRNAEVQETAAAWYLPPRVSEAAIPKLSREQKKLPPQRRR